MRITKPRGTNDFLPADTAQWQFIERSLREICHDFGFEEIRTPIFEDTDLFIRGVGDTTDIVQKEMYTFEDSGGRSLTLRPENTASVVRAYLENKVYAGVQPTKLYYMGPMFRCERPQAGRFRQFHQFGVEILGSSAPASDAEAITLAWEFYRRLGLTDLEVHLNSVGCPHCRPQHREALQAFLRPNLEHLCPTCQGRFEKNPLRIFDCKNPHCQELIAGAPTILECLCEECSDHFAQVKSYLDALGIPYLIDDRLVRGLDYYTKTAFEILLNGIGAQSALCGGGRYDGLVEEIGGDSTPGVGFALGMERVFSALKQCEIELPQAQAMQVFVACAGVGADILGFQFVYELRRVGIAALQDTLARSLKAQMKYAAKFAVSYALIIGEDELANGTVTLRNMANSEQETVLQTEIVSKLTGLLK